MATLLKALRYSCRHSPAKRTFSVLPSLNQFLEPPDVELPDDFSFFPNFLDDEEQRVLLASALRQLDHGSSRAARRKLKYYMRNRDVYVDSPTVRDIFFPEDSGCYEFEEGHYDGVIQHYREMQVTNWPPDPRLESVLHRVRSLLPTVLPQSAILTHILHLSSKGEIFPHVDNVDASGSWIAAVSLGHKRVLRMEGPKTFEIMLPSGCAYVQRDTVRYSYKHSILRYTTFKDRCITPGQRISVVLRDRLQPNLK